MSSKALAGHAGDSTLDLISEPSSGHQSPKRRTPYQDVSLAPDHSPVLTITQVQATRTLIPMPSAMTIALFVAIGITRAMPVDTVVVHARHRAVRRFPGRAHAHAGGLRYRTKTPPTFRRA